MGASMERITWLQLRDVLNNMGDDELTGFVYGEINCEFIPLLLYEHMGTNEFPQLSDGELYFMPVEDYDE